MLLEDIHPLHFKFSVAGFDFKAEDFDDKLIQFSVKDSGGLEVGTLTVTFDEDGENVEVTDLDSPGTLDRLRNSGESDSIMRQIKRVVRSTL